MWELSMGVYLFTGTIFDLIKRKIPVIYLAAGSVMAIVYRIFYCKGAWFISVCGAMMGVFFLVLSKCTEEQIGYGDSWMILNLGIYLGIWELIVMLVIVFGTSFVFAFLGLMFRKMTRKTRIPFFPFLMLGYLGAVMW